MRIFSIAVVLLVAACVTTTRGGPIAPAPANKALVVIYRPSQFTGVDIEAPFTVDGERLFELEPGERAELLLAPGPHELTTSKEGVLQASAPGITRLDVKAGNRYFFEWSAMASSVQDYEFSTGVFREVSADVGLREAKKETLVYRSDKANKQSASSRD